MLEATFTVLLNEFLFNTPYKYAEEIKTLYRIYFALTKCIGFDRYNSTNPIYSVLVISLFYIGVRAMFYCTELGIGCNTGIKVSPFQSLVLD